jgi:hypothetical protein
MIVFGFLCAEKSFHTTSYSMLANVAKELFFAIAT